MEVSDFVAKLFVSWQFLLDVGHIQSEGSDMVNCDCMLLLQIIKHHEHPFIFITLPQHNL